MDNHYNVSFLLQCLTVPKYKWEKNGINSYELKVFRLVGN